MKILNPFFLGLCAAGLISAAVPGWASLGMALTTGNPALLKTTSESSIIDAALFRVNSIQRLHNKMLFGIYGADIIKYAPSKASSLLRILEQEQVFPLLVGNQGNNLGVYGTSLGGRFAAYGSSPVRYFLSENSAAYEKPYKRVLSWLVSGIPGSDTALSAPKNIALSYNGSDLGQMTAWLGKNMPKWNTSVCNNAATIPDCYKNKDLIILNWGNVNHDATQDNVVLAAIKAHLQAKKPILYLDTWALPDGNLNKMLAPVLGFDQPYGGNFWANDKVDIANISAVKPVFADYKILLTHFKKKDFNFDWSKCSEDRGCSGEPTIQKEFYDGAQRIKIVANVWEQKNVDIFSQNGRILNKLMILLGDKFRSSIKYPLAKETNPTAFLKAYYADHADYTTRRVNTAQPDLGAFSGSLASITPINATITLTNKQGTASQSSGYYALPGKTLTLTRTDNNPAKAYLHINMLRGEAEHVFSWYDRPRFLWGQSIPLVAGKPVKIASAIGGIIFINIEGSTTPQQIQLNAVNVTPSVIYDGTNAEQFKTMVNTSPLGWAELKFSGVEVHSRMDMMKRTLANTLIGGDPDRLGYLTKKYFYEDVYNLAGFVGDGIGPSATVLNFCNNHNWDCTNPIIHAVPNVQHANVDRAACGSGCSGNPYDQSWVFNPLGGGETHEVGHNLQYGHLKIYGSETTEISNNIFPLHKWVSFNQDPNETKKYDYDSGLKAIFGDLQLAAQNADPITAAYNTIWTNGWKGLNFYWEAVLSSSNVPHLGDKGWDLYRLMYIQDRLLSNLSSSDAVWLANRNKLGFSQYAISNLSGLNGNDFMLISMSYITKRDQRAYFDMWGIRYSALASQQVASYGFPSAPKVFWVVPVGPGKGIPDPLSTPVPIDGVSPWPL